MNRQNILLDPLVLVPCAKTSKDYRCQAMEMYSPSVYFQKIWKYAHLMGDSIMILSSKYGLLHPETVIDPYNEYLSNTTKAKKWATRVGPDLVRLVAFSGFKRVIFLTGQKYSNYLKGYLIDIVEDRGLIFEDPMEGLGIGERLQWLTKRINNEEVAIICEKCGNKGYIYYEDYQEEMLSDGSLLCKKCDPHPNDIGDLDEYYENPEYQDGND